MEDVEQGEADEAAVQETLSQKRERATERRRNRGKLPGYLPRIETVMDVEAKAYPYCNGTLHCIGEDVSERLDIFPAQFHVLVTRRPMICLPSMRRDHRAGAGDPSSDRGRHADRGYHHPRAGLRIC